MYRVLQRPFGCVLSTLVGGKDGGGKIKNEKYFTAVRIYSVCSFLPYNKVILLYIDTHTHIVFFIFFPL